MDSLTDREDIIFSFENSTKDKVSITDSLIIYSTEVKGVISENIIFPINRIDSYKVSTKRKYEFFVYSFFGLMLWNWLYSEVTSCGFLWFSCTTQSNFFQGILDGWWILIPSAICLYVGFLKDTKLIINSISNEKIEMLITEVAEEKKAKEFIIELSKIYSRFNHLQQTKINPNQ